MANPVIAPVIAPVNKKPGNNAMPVVQATTLMMIHHPAQYTSWRRISHWAMPVVRPTTRPATNSMLLGITMSSNIAPNDQPSVVARIHRQGRQMRCCNKNHCRMPRASPMVTMERFGNRSLPKTQPNVVAMIHSNHSAQSKKTGFWRLIQNA